MKDDPTGAFQIAFREPEVQAIWVSANQRQYGDAKLATLSMLSQTFISLARRLEVPTGTSVQLSYERYTIWIHRETTGGVVVVTDADSVGWFDYLPPILTTGLELLAAHGSQILNQTIHTHPSTRTQHPTIQHPTIQHPTIQHPTIQHPTIQHPTIQHPTIQHPTMHNRPTQTSAIRVIQHPTMEHPTQTSNLRPLSPNPNLSQPPTLSSIRNGTITDTRQAPLKHSGIYDAVDPGETTAELNPTVIEDLIESLRPFIGAMGKRLIKDVMYALRLEVNQLMDQEMINAFIEEVQRRVDKNDRENLGIALDEILMGAHDYGH